MTVVVATVAAGCSARLRPVTLLNSVTMKIDINRVKFLEIMISSLEQVRSDDVPVKTWSALFGKCTKLNDLVIFVLKS